jgi:EpsI family protein
MRDYRAYVPAAILLVGCGLIWHTRTQESVPLVGSLHAVLADVKGFEVTDQKISAEEERVAGMTNYVARSYKRDGAVAFTTLVSYYDKQTQGKTIHSPRNCLPGAGWEIMSGGTQVVSVDGKDVKVNRYLLKNGPLEAVAYYWYQGRGRVTANEYLVKWNLLRDAALLGHTEEALVRVVVPVSRAAKATASVAGSQELKSADATAQQVSAKLITDVFAVVPNPRSIGS